jgi:hypothetical protein
MIRVKELNDEERGILKFLGGKGELESFDNIRNYLHKSGYGSLSERNARKELDQLIDLGYIRSRTVGSGTDREERFYLSRGIGAGRRAKSTLQGRDYVLGDIGQWVKRIFGKGYIFLVFGLGFLVYSGISSTGMVISSEGSPLDAGFVLSFMLMLIGGALLLKKSKK